MEIVERIEDPTQEDETMRKLDIYRYFTMSKRERRYELQHTLWMMPLRYIGVALLLSLFTFTLDVVIDLPERLPKGLLFDDNITKLLITTLVGGVLTLSAFTINSLLVALTTFGSQFSSRMLLNFISDRPTQHVLGVFNGSFIYVLLNILYLSNSKQETFFSIPVLSVTVTFIAAVTFIYFVNHTSTWMQVHNITVKMKNSTKSIIQSSLLTETEPYRTEEENIKDELTNTREAKTIYAKTSGYLQLADFSQIIQEAQKDNIVIEIRAAIGQFILADTPLFDYWQGDEPINEEKYNRLVRVGVKQTELQDLEFGTKKLAEIAIKALGNKDPLTVINTLHQMTDLLKEIGNVTNFSSFLVDDQKHLRLKIKVEDFHFYLHKTFGIVREYAGKENTVITTIIEMLGLLAQVMDERFHDDIWQFTKQTIKGYQEFTMYENDCYFLLEELYRVALSTNNEIEYKPLEKILLDRTYL